MIDYLNIIKEFYPDEGDAFNLLTAHSTQVAHRAIEIVTKKHLDVNADFIIEAAMLHDIGVFKTNAPNIFCFGNEPYLMHGIIGAGILRDKGMEAHARVCERHIGSGLTCKEIISQNLPLPHQDFLPETIEEKLICYADIFFSKSDINKIRTVADVQRQMQRFGEDAIGRLNSMIEIFE